MSLRAEYLNLHSLHPLSTILSHCPKLANLSLANNKLPNFDALLPLRNTPLNELILTGNPVRENEVRKNGSESAKWRAGVRKIFPTLKILDDMPVEDGEEEMEDDQQASQRGPKGVQLPLPIQKGFADMDETRLLVADFVSKFFPLFDANRNALLALYHPNAVFSLSASTAAPPGHRPQNRRVDDMTGWFGRNRSHERVKGGGLYDEGGLV